MNRRDFLRLRTDAGRPVFELSCERLFMVYTDTRGAEGGLGDPEAALAQRESEGTGTAQAVWPAGEPAAVHRRAHVDEVFRNLERRLAEFEILKVLDSGWLSADEAFGARVRSLLQSFEARGGRVEFPA